MMNARYSTSADCNLKQTNMTLDWYQYFQIIALILAIIYFRGLKRFRLSPFIPILLIVNIVESIGTNYKNLGWSDNYSVYNLYLLFSTPLYLYLYATMLELKGKALIIHSAVSIGCMVFIILNLFFLQGTGVFNTYSMALISILYIVFSCLVLFRMTLGSNLTVNLYRQPYFWINSTNLFFSMTTLVFLGLQHYILTNNIKLGDKTLYYAIMPSANAVYYSGLSYAFILCNQNRS